MATNLVDKLARGTVRLVVDHHQVHHARNVVSAHVNEFSADGKLIKGEDRDDITPEDLGGTGDVERLAFRQPLAAFIAKETGLPTTSDVLPPAPKAEADTPATGAP